MISNKVILIIKKEKGRLKKMKKLLNKVESTNEKSNPVTLQTVEAYAAAILEPYTKPRDLLKEWDKTATEENFDALKKFAAEALQHYFREAFIFEAGKKPACGNLIYCTETEDLFGLPYISSGSKFAAVWNTNTQARARLPFFNLYFKAVAIQPRPDGKYRKYDFIYYFMDNSENEYYFTSCEYLSIKKQLEELNRAAALASFNKAVNELTPAALEVLKKYDGKKAGEKTRDKIRQELNALTAAEEFKKISIYIDFSEYRPALTFEHFNYYDFKKCIYCKIYDAASNTIITPAELPAPVKEFNPVEALHELQKTADEAQKAAAVLLPYIEAYNNAARLLNLPKLPLYDLNIKSLADSGAEYAAKR